MKEHSSLIPGRLASRPRDPRGYPIPFIVMIDNAGKPHFTINDAEKATAVICEHRCALCGKPLGDNVWFIGGPAAAFHPSGGYIDPPAHRDCATFALKVCPFLAVSYGRRIDAKTVDPTALPAAVIIADNNMPSGQPAVFVLARTSRYSVASAGDTGGIILVPKRPWRAVEFWRRGEQITPEQARLLTKDDPRAPAPLEDLTLWQDV